MTAENSAWQDTLIHLFALASRLEGAGQYNLAKLARAAADALSRQAAYRIELPTENDRLAVVVQETAATLSGLNFNADLVTALHKGADIMAQGQLPLIDVVPHPYVCRTCGYLLLGEPVADCPTCRARPGSFQQFLPVYWLDAYGPMAAMARLQQTPIEVQALIAGLSEAELNQQPQDGGWAIRNVLSHLRDAQGVLSFRLELFLEAEHPILESKAVFTWATQEADRPPAAREIYETYQTSRQETLNKLAKLPLAEWWRSGQHEEFGEVTLGQQVSYFAAHELTHLPQIENVRRQLGPG